MGGRSRSTGRAKSHTRRCGITGAVVRNSRRARIDDVPHPQRAAVSHTPCVGQFVANGQTEFLLAVLFEPVPAERYRNRVVAGSYFVRPVCRFARCETSQAIASTGRSRKCSANVAAECCCARSSRAVGVSGGFSVAESAFFMGVRWSVERIQLVTSELVPNRGYLSHRNQLQNADWDSIDFPNHRTFAVIEGGTEYTYLLGRLVLDAPCAIK